MSEEKLEEKEEKEEKQEENKEEKKIIINSYYYYHSDMFSSPATLLLIEFKNSTEQVLVKRRIIGDMYYIPYYDGYIKLWQDRKGNVLFYYNNYKKQLDGIFVDKIDYYSDFHPCEGVEIQINGPLKTFLEKYDCDEDLLNIIKSIICRKFNF